jgi:hypothetical protein
VELMTHPVRKSEFEYLMSDACEWHPVAQCDTTAVDR